MKKKSVRSIRSIPGDDEVLISSLIRRKKKPVRRKTKYLSLRLQLSSPDKSLSQSPESIEVPSSEEAHDENMAYLFSAEDGGASTLTGLLDKGSQPSDDKNNDVSSGTMSPSSDSLTYGRCREVALVRTALRNKEREASEERWVQYSKVVERRDDQEVSSSAAEGIAAARWKGNENQRLSLKLDYEEILTAWSDKGSLFVHPAVAPPPPLPQIVPDMQDDFIVPQFPQGLINHGWGNVEWHVPEFTQGPGLQLGNVKMEDQQDHDQNMAAAQVELVVVGGEEQWRMSGQREASVKRYKEKRRNRLFSKRIRYEVRKVNAEKRPRVKGRFVKRN